MKHITTSVITIDFHNHHIKGKAGQTLFPLLWQGDRSCTAYLDPKAGKRMNEGAGATTQLLGFLIQFFPPCGTPLKRKGKKNPAFILKFNESLIK